MFLYVVLSIRLEWTRTADLVSDLQNYEEAGFANIRGMAV